MTDQPERDVPDLAAAIAGADEGRRRPEPPPPSGWAGLVERDRRARRAGSPNAAGGFASILYPWRLYIAAAAVVLLPILIIISILS